MPTKHAKIASKPCGSREKRSFATLSLSVSDAGPSDSKNRSSDKPIFTAGCSRKKQSPTTKTIMAPQESKKKNSSATSTVTTPGGSKKKRKSNIPKITASVSSTTITTPGSERKKTSFAKLTIIAPSFSKKRNSTKPIINAASVSKKLRSTIANNTVPGDPKKTRNLSTSIFTAPGGSKKKIDSGLIAPTISALSGSTKKKKSLTKATITAASRSKRSVTTAFIATQSDSKKISLTAATTAAPGGSKKKSVTTSTAPEPGGPDKERSSTTATIAAPGGSKKRSLTVATIAPPGGSKKKRSLTAATIAAPGGSKKKRSLTAATIAAPGGFKKRSLTAATTAVPGGSKRKRTLTAATVVMSCGSKKTRSSTTIPITEVGVLDKKRNITATIGAPGGSKEKRSLIIATNAASVGSKKKRSLTTPTYAAPVGPKKRSLTTATNAAPGWSYMNKSLAIATIRETSVSKKRTSRGPTNTNGDIGRQISQSTAYQTRNTKSKKTNNVKTEASIPKCGQLSKQRQGSNPFSSRNAKFVTKFGVLGPKEAEPYITGSAFLPDSRLLLVDHDNKKLKMFDVNYKLVAYKQFNDSPFAVAVWDSTEVAVIIVRENVGGNIKHADIVKLSVDCDVIKEKGTISLGIDCSSLFYITRDSLAVTGINWIVSTTDFRREDFFRVYTIDGRQLSQLTLGNGDCQDPFRVTVDRQLSRAYVCTRWGNVSAVDLNTNKIVFTYKHKNRHPEGITVDQDHNVYICDLTSHIIQQVPRGTCIQILQRKEGGLHHEITVSFTPSGDSFVVAGYNWKDHTAHVYKMV